MVAQLLQNIINGNQLARAQLRENPVHRALQQRQVVQALPADRMLKLDQLVRPDRSEKQTVPITIASQIVRLTVVPKEAERILIGSELNLAALRATATEEAEALHLEAADLLTIARAGVVVAVDLLTTGLPGLLEEEAIPRADRAVVREALVAPEVLVLLDREAVEEGNSSITQIFIR